MDDRLGLLYTLLGILAILVGAIVTWFTKYREPWRRVKSRASATVDVFAGREPIFDEATGRTLPGIPPLHERLLATDAKLERTDSRMERIERAVESLANVHTRLDNAEHRIGVLELAQLDRASIRLEAAAAMQTADRLAGEPILDVEAEPGDTDD